MRKFTKQILKNMINSNIEFCDNCEDEVVHKYKPVFESVLNKNKTYAPTLRNLQKNIQQIIQHISKQMQKKKKETETKKKSSIGW